MDPPAFAEPFDCVLLRNVMIYFDPPSRERVLRHGIGVMPPGAPLIVGESECLMNTQHGFQFQKPSIFCKPMPPVTSRA